VTSQTIPSTIVVDRYLLASLMPDLVGHDRAPSAYLLYLTLWRLVEGDPERTVAASLQKLSAETGLSKTAVQRAVIHLRRRGLISATQENPTAAPRYRLHTPWRGARSA
jgi:hypothetical protein